MGRLVKDFDFTIPAYEEQAQSAIAYYADQDVRHQEWLDSIPQLILDEKHTIDTALAEGRDYVINEHSDGPVVIHRFTCATIRHQTDRDLAWQYHDQDGRGYSYGGTISVDRMPNLGTREDVEALVAYRACMVCNPDTNDRIRRRTPAIRPTPVQAIGRRHLGRSFETLEGEPMGVLVSVTMSTEATTLHFDSGDYLGQEADLVVMRPKQP
ncbi:MAG: hypothetical protein ABIQ01_05725 [Pseudolysinimonas sp.]